MSNKLLSSIQSFNIILARCNIGQQKKGVEFGSNVLLKTMLSNSIKPSNLCKTNYFKTNQEYIQLNDFTKKSLDKYRLTGIIGGDHSISGASVPAFFDKYKEDAHLIWIDAHPDLNTNITSISQNSHGMPVSKIFGLMKNSVPSVYTPNFKQITYIGLRSIDLPEKDFIEEYKISKYSSEYINTTGIDDILKILKKNLNYKNIYISLDVDSLDPKFCPSTGTPVENGLHPNTINKIIKTLKPNIKCFDIVEFNPLIGSERDINNSKKNIIGLLAEFVN